MLVAVRMLLSLALPLFAQSGADSIAREMVRQAQTAAWGQVYEGRPGCGKFLANDNTYSTAIAQWSYACTAASNGIARTEFYYATPYGTVTLQYLHLSVASMTDAADEVFSSIRARLTQALGESIGQFGLLYTGAWEQPSSKAGVRWSIPAAELILHRNQHYPLYGERLYGPQLVVIERGRFQMTEQERALDLSLGMRLFGSAIVGKNRIRGDFSQYASLMDIPSAWPKDPTGIRQATLDAALDLLRQSESAGINEKGELLIAADELVERLSNLLVMEASGEIARAAPLTVTARRLLQPFHAKLGEPTHYGGLDYQHDLLQRAVRETAGTEWGEIAFLRNLVLGCPAVDFFGAVIHEGEAYLIRHPDMKYRKDLLFSLAIAYESWWSATNAPAAATLTFEQFAPLRSKYVSGSREARLKATQLYEEVIRLAPKSPEAMMAARQLPRLKLGLDTGQRAYVCLNC